MESELVKGKLVYSRDGEMKDSIVFLEIRSKILMYNEHKSDAGMRAESVFKVMIRY